MELDVGWRLVGGAWLVGLDGGAETVLVGDIVDLAIDSVGVGVAVASGTLAVLVTVLLVVLGAAVAVVDVVAPSEGHWWVLVCAENWLEQVRKLNPFYRWFSQPSRRWLANANTHVRLLVSRCWLGVARGGLAVR